MINVRAEEDRTLIFLRNMLQVNNIYLGDCTELLRESLDNSVDLIVTDPPYGINYKSNKQNTDTRKGNSVKKKKAEYFTAVQNDEELPTEWLTSAYRILKDGGAIYICCHWSKWHLLYTAVEKAGFAIKNMIILNKSNHGMGDLEGSFAPTHELVLFATKGRHLLRGKRLKDIWPAKVLYSGSQRWHPEEKPVEWMQQMVLSSSDPGDLVLDPFVGSGTTLLAAKCLNRKFIGIEIDEDHFNTLQRRMKENTTMLFG